MTGITLEHLKLTQKVTQKDLVRKTEEIVSTIDCYSLPSMSVDDVINYIQNYSEGEEFKLDFLSFADEIIGEKSGQSKKTYQSAVNSFKSFLEKDSLDIAEVTSTLMRSWEKWLRAKYGDSGRAVSAYTACIAFIHGQARLRYNNEETGVVKIRNPFQYYKPPRQKPAAHRAVDTKIIQKMIKLRPTFDDVITRGTSFVQCAEQIIKKGAASVTGLFLGRTLR